jgi:hypothetical protein
MVVAEGAAGLLWVLRISHANPDGYDDRWCLPIVVLAAAYIWLVMRYARRRS